MVPSSPWDLLDSWSALTRITPAREVPRRPLPTRRSKEEDRIWLTLRPVRRLFAAVVKERTSKGQVHIRSSFNSTPWSVTDAGAMLCPGPPSGGLGFRGGKKSTPFGAQSAAETGAKAAMGMAEDRGGLCRGPGQVFVAPSVQRRPVGLEPDDDQDVTIHSGCR